MLARSPARVTAMALVMLVSPTLRMLMLKVWARLLVLLAAMRPMVVRAV